MTPDRATILDVAREAGVSAMTVSRVVNKKGDVRAETRERVLAAIERLGYRPSGIARGLATRRTGALGLVVPDITNPFFSEIARGVERQACELGYHVYLCNTHEDVDRERALLASLETQRVDGLVSCSSRLPSRELRALLPRFPTAVLVNRRINKIDIDSVMVDDRWGGRLATDHLLALGRRAIGFLLGPSTSHSGRKRLGGFRWALKRAGVSYRREWLQRCRPTVEDGQQTAEALLAAHPELTALLCFNDLVAVGALQACQRRGVRVPEEVSVVGFDDIPLAPLVTPPLTTCRVERDAVGAAAMRLLAGRLEEPGKAGPSHVLFRPRLVVRGSSGRTQEMRAEG